MWTLVSDGVFCCSQLLLNIATNVSLQLVSVRMEMVSMYQYLSHWLYLNVSKSFLQTDWYHLTVVSMQFAFVVAVG